MKLVNKIISFALCILTPLILVSCKKSNIETPKAKTEAIGFIVYQKTSESDAYENIKATPTKISDYFEITDNQARTTSNHLFYLFSTDAFESGSQNIKTNTTTKDYQLVNGTLSFTFELILESTEAIVFIIYKDEKGSIYYEFDKTLNDIDSSPITSILNFDENSFVNKLDITFAKNITEQEEYQR